MFGCGDDTWLERNDGGRFEQDSNFLVLCMSGMCLTRQLVLKQADSKLALRVNLQLTMAALLAS